MKLIFIFQFFIFFNVAVAQTTNEVKSYISKYLPTHKIYSGKLKIFYEDSYSDETPWSVNLDFNGDGKNDWIGFLERDLGKNRRQNLISDLDLFCICSSTSGFQHLILEKSVSYVDDENTTNSAIFAVKSDLYKSQVDGQGDVNIQNNSVEWTDFEKASIVYYWENDQVKKFWTSD